MSLYDIREEQREQISMHTKNEHKELVELQEKVKEYGRSLNHFEELLENSKDEAGETNLPETEKSMRDEFRFLQKRFNDIQDLVTSGFELEMHQRFDELEKKNHTDCLKVYRNVQAVVVEELAKQNKLLVRDDKAIMGIKRKMNTVLVFSIISLIIAIALIVLEILPMFGIKLF